MRTPSGARGSGCARSVRLPEEFIMRFSTDIHFAEGSTPDVLESIRVQGVNLAVWRRDVDGLVDERSLQGFAGRLDMVAPDAPTLSTDLPGCPSLIQDIAHLAVLFGRVAGTRHPRVRLERVEDDGCALFHADSLSVRMLCTYAGKGTEWLENDNVNWKELGLRDRTLDEANAAIVRDPLAVRRIPTGAVALFSGSGREGARPLIHRSAPLEPGDGFRLRLCIDLPGNCGC